MSFVQMLRAATAADHDRVDARFSGFVLDDPSDYRRFLVAHARALPAVEAALARDPALPVWRRRTQVLAGDLAAMGEGMPARLAFEAEGAACWGALYVAEGSRLGGQLLARSVPAGLPTAYLAARHEPGEWRAMLGAIEVEAGRADDGWRQIAIAGARATFALYASAIES
jgi:heme oxygenase